MRSGLRRCGILVMMLAASCKEDASPAERDAGLRDGSSEAAAPEGPSQVPEDAGSTDGEPLSPDSETMGSDASGEDAAATDAGPGADSTSEGHPEPPASAASCAPGRCRFARVALGHGTTCLVEHDGTARCFGSNVGGSAEVPAGQYRQVFPLDGFNSVGLAQSGRVVYFGGRIFGTSLPEPRESDYLEIAGGYDRLCGRRLDRTLDCWGRIDAAAPPPGRFLALSGFAAAFCGIREDREVLCWPQVGSTNASAAPPGPWQQVSRSGGHACGLRPDGTIMCWGDRDDGQLAVPPGTYAEVQVGSRFSCARTVAGAVVCWGQEPVVYPGPTGGPFMPLAGTYHQLTVTGNQGCGQRSDGVFVCFGAHSRGEATLPDDQAVARVNQTCFLRADASADCWDPFAVVRPGPYLDISGSSGQGCTLGLDGQASCWSLSGNLQTAPAGGTYSALRVNGAMGCGLRKDTAAIDCWGRGLLVPAWLPPPGRYRDLAVGDGLGGCGIREDGTVQCWGSDREEPVISGVPAGTFETVALASGDRACGVRTGGEVSCWGRATTRDLPPGPYRQVSPGEEFSVALRPDGALVSFDVLGPAYQPRLPPGTFKQLGPVLRGERRTFACALEVSGRVRCWGDVLR
jgi:hypothetical protein